MHRIDSITARQIELPLKEPFHTAYRSAATSPTVFVEIKSAEISGVGEATPVKQVTGEDPAGVVADIEAAAAAVEGADLEEYQDALRKLAIALPQGKSARAGIEMAIYDAYSKIAGVPVYSLLGGRAVPIETDVTIPICPASRAAESAKEMSAGGFRMFKVKVGTDREEDVERVAAVSKSAPGASLILDANQGYAPDEAVEFVRALQVIGVRISLIEQPVNANDLEGMRYVTQHVSVPVFADESVLTPSDALEVARRGAASGVNVKIMKAGILGALQIQSVCRASGLALMLGCMLESKIGQSAAVHIACATNAFSFFDLDSDLLLAEPQPVKGGVVRRAAYLEVSDSPGLGCEILEGAL